MLLICNHLCWTLDLWLGTHRLLLQHRVGATRWLLLTICLLVLGHKRAVGKKLYPSCTDKSGSTESCSSDQKNGLKRETSTSYQPKLLLIHWTKLIQQAPAAMRRPLKTSDWRISKELCYFWLTKLKSEFMGLTLNKATQQPNEKTRYVPSTQILVRFCPNFTHPSLYHTCMIFCPLQLISLVKYFWIFLKQNTDLVNLKDLWKRGYISLSHSFPERPTLL